MDIRKFSAQNTGRLVLKTAGDEIMTDDSGKEMAIVYFSPGSKEYSRATSKMNNRNIERLRKKGKIDQTPEQKTAEAAEFLADCTQSFENIDYDKLQGRELFIAVYSDLSLGFIADQGAKYISDWANFSQGLVKN